VVQIVDFGSRLILEAHKLYSSSSGQKQEYTELEDITDSLVRSNNDLKRSLTSTESHDLFSNEKDLQFLCDECQVIAEELIRTLNTIKLKENEGKWESLQQALKSMWGKAKIENLKKRLDGFRQQLIIVILTALR
jgi:hypothetical protein